MSLQQSIFYLWLNGFVQLVIFCQEFLQSLSQVDSHKNFLKFVFSNTKCYSWKLFYQIARLHLWLAVSLINMKGRCKNTARLDYYLHVEKPAEVMGGFEPLLKVLQTCTSPLGHMTNLNRVRRCLIRKIYFEEIYFLIPIAQQGWLLHNINEWYLIHSFYTFTRNTARLCRMFWDRQVLPHIGLYYLKLVIAAQNNLC